MTDDKTEGAVPGDAVEEFADFAEASADASGGDLPDGLPGRDWQRIVAFVLLPALLIVLGVVAGLLKWQSESFRVEQVAAAESVAAARDATTAILSYSAGNVEKDLNAARERLTGSFLDAYTKLVNEVVIPGSKEKKISAVAQVPAAASVSATSTHAVALVFVNQATTIGNGAPTNTASTVRVTLDKIRGRWLVSGFDPV